MNNGRDVFFSPSFHSVGRKKVVTLRKNGLLCSSVCRYDAACTSNRIWRGKEKGDEHLVSLLFRFVVHHTEALSSLASRIESQRAIDVYYSTAF